MAINLTSGHRERLQEIHAANRRLFNLGVGQLVCVLLLSVVVWLNQNRIDSFMGDGGPWGRPALERLRSIQPETAREAYLLAVFREIVPLPINAVKISFIRSTLMWLFITALMMIVFARYQKKSLDLMDEIINP